MFSCSRNTNLDYTPVSSLYVVTSTEHLPAKTVFGFIRPAQVRRIHRLRPHPTSSSRRPRTPEATSPARLRRHALGSARLIAAHRQPRPGRHRRHSQAHRATSSGAASLAAARPPSGPPVINGTARLIEPPTQANAHLAASRPRARSSSTAPIPRAPPRQQHGHPEDATRPGPATHPRADRHAARAH